LLAGLSQHGYTILFAIVFMESIGLPVPAAIALLIAGGASARGSLYLPVAAASALLASIIGDTLMFLLGRYTGWWLLGLLCRLSLNPESCILRSAESFYKRGKITLVIAKFVPGINTMAAPLAGTMKMPFGQFFRLDMAGSFLYAATYLAIGYVCRDFLAATLNSAGALRGVTERPAPSVRDVPAPIAPVPIDSERPSSVPLRGSWQLAHATSRFPLRILSKKSERPRSTSAGSGAETGSTGTTPHGLIACRTCWSSDGFAAIDVTESLLQPITVAVANTSANRALTSRVRIVVDLSESAAKRRTGVSSPTH